MALILVVDDYPGLQRILSLTLQMHDYLVVTAGNGREALSLLRTEAIDLVITDVSIPEMDGLSLLGEIRADKALSDLPVIVLTAIGQEEVREAAAQKGASGFLTKPPSSQELVEVVSRFLADEKPAG